MATINSYAKGLVVMAALILVPLALPHPSSGASWDLFYWLAFMSSAATPLMTATTTMALDLYRKADRHQGFRNS